MIRAALLFASLVSVVATVLANEPAKPNFIVIMVDDMGYAGVSCFGNPYFKTPKLIGWQRKA